MVRTTSYLQTQTILRSLEFTLAKGGFHGNAGMHKAAVALLRDMKSTRSVSGRHEQVTHMLKSGATIDELIHATHSSRRTIFRYLNHLENAGIDIVILDGKYRLK